MKLFFPFWIDMAVPVFMIISGFVSAKSSVRHNCISTGDCLRPDAIILKAIRYTVPFAAAYFFEAVALLAAGSSLGPWTAVLIFFQGGIGPGSYYYPVMIQFLFWFPVLYSLILKYDFHGLLLCAGINFAYEFLQIVYQMNEDCYRFLLFRYTLVIAFGCYLAVGKAKIQTRILYAGAFLGVIYIIIFKYLSLSPLITRYWTGTSLFACLYILPAAAKLLRSNFSCPPLELLGKASYNIFLVQMVYYTGASFIYSAVPNRALQLLINFVVCITGGIVFYYVEQPITRSIQKMAVPLCEKANDFLQ